MQKEQIKELLRTGQNFDFKAYKPSSAQPIKVKGYDIREFCSKYKDHYTYDYDEQIQIIDKSQIKQACIDYMNGSDTEYYITTEGKELIIHDNGTFELID